MCGYDAAIPSQVSAATVLHGDAALTALVQTCIVHLIRYSLSFASWKERKAIASALEPIYQADSTLCGKTAWIASGKPFNPSTTAIGMSCVPRTRRCSGFGSSKPEGACRSPGRRPCC